MKLNWPLLAGLRFALAFLVMIIHLGEIMTPSPLERLGLKMGFGAVAAFLLISGLSIAHSISTRPEGFIGRRIDRIFPVYLVCLFAALLPFVIGGGYLTLPPSNHRDAPTLAEFAAGVFMLQAIAVKPMSTFEPSWSLAFECAFYLAAPLLIKLHPRKVAYLCAASVVWCAARYQFTTQPFMVNIGPGGPLAAACFWLFGWLLYFRPQSRLLQATVLIVPAALMPLTPGTGTADHIPVIATALAVLWQGEIVVPEKWKAALLYAGDLSYPMYLIHVPAYALTWACFGTSNPLLALAAALFLSAVIYHWVDLPYRRRQKHRRPAPAIATA